MKTGAGKFIKDNLKTQLFPVIMLIIGYFAVSVFSVLFALFSQYVVDSAVKGDFATFTYFAICMAGFGILQIVINMICRFCEEKIKARFDMKMRGNVFSAFLYKKYREQTKFHSGEIINRLSNDTAVISDGIIGILPHFFQFVSKIIFTVIVLFGLDWRFALTVVICGTAVFFGLRFLKITIKRYHKRVQEADGAVRSEWQDSLASLPVIKAYSAEKEISEKSDGLLFSHFVARMKRRTVGILSSTGLETVFRLGNLFAIVWGCLMLYSEPETFTFGTLTAILQLLSSIQAPFNQLSNMIPRYYQVTASAERLCEVLSLEDKGSDKLPPNADFTSLKFENVTFSYGEETVLENASFEVKKGETVSVSGVSGGGKSTVLKLLLSLYTDYLGKISLIAKDGSELPLSDMKRGLFSYVPQDAQLFSGSIRDNITFKRDCSEEEIKKALAVCCGDFVFELPNGLDTVLTERGGGLSEGQKQRLSVCRAVLFDAPIFILDEATSALDVQTEKQMLENLKALGKTVIMVNHRPAAQSYADRALTVKDKKVY
ncbi:MAG: ABC transporter ATP-binding protein [Clostridia bacterium]|nr:ABC transporter ATP-binding protein [Clostridia bacterium]